MLTSCSVSASDLRSIQELIEYYRSDLAQALIRHERSLQLSLHQMKLIGKDKCASENLQVAQKYFFCMSLYYVRMFVGSDSRNVYMPAGRKQITSTVTIASFCVLCGICFP